MTKSTTFALETEAGNVLFVVYKWVNSAKKEFPINKTNEKFLFILCSLVLRIEFAYLVL
jgi:hypothetical protein